MNLENLQLFSDVMLQRSFARVAQQHGIAPSSVSRAIKSLEREIGVRLFQRSTRKLVPTEATMSYFSRVRPALDEIETARQIAVDADAQPRGTLRITAPAVFSNRAIVPLLPSFAAEYPELALELLISDTYTDLVEQRIDLAIRLGSLEDSSFIARRLQPMQFYICASPAYLERHGRPELPDDIGSHQCLLFPRAGYGLDWLLRDRDGEVTRVPISGKILITNSDSIRQCALAGMGLALLPDGLVDDAIENGRLLRLFSQYDVSATDYDGAIWILYPSRRYLPLKARVFIDFLLRHFGGADEPAA